MKIHAVQTGTVTIRPNQRQGKGIGLARLVNTLFDRRWTESLPIYAWLIEHPEGIIVIETGANVTSPDYLPAWNPYLKNAILQVQPEQEISPQLQALGIHPKEVRKIDGLTLNSREAQKTLNRIREFAHATPCIYLPTHDPESGTRLAAKKTVDVESMSAG